jgi:hypothetical protein
MDVVANHLQVNVGQAASGGRLVLDHVEGVGGAAYSEVGDARNPQWPRLPTLWRPIRLSGVAR